MKYELTTTFIEYKGKKLYQIKALKDFGDVYAGELGGYIEKESNLSQEGDCWIFVNAKAYDEAKVYDDAYVRGYAEVFGSSKIRGNARTNIGGESINY